MDREKVVNGLKAALQTELDGIQFYKMVAEKTSDQKGKAVFTQLADDEKQHFNELQKQLNSVMNSNKWVQSISIEDATIFRGESPIFSEELRSRIKDKHFEMSALSIGALLEANSIDFYRKMKEDTEDPTAKDLFGRLQKWEQAHLEAITRQLNLLKEEYWIVQKFTPLF